jgi:hypothetical protein
VDDTPQRALTERPHQEGIPSDQERPPSETPRVQKTPTPAALANVPPAILLGVTGVLALALVGCVAIATGHDGSIATTVIGAILGVVGAAGGFHAIALQKGATNG